MMTILYISYKALLGLEGTLHANGFFGAPRCPTKGTLKHLPGPECISVFLTLAFILQTYPVNHKEVRPKPYAGSSAD